MKPTTIQHALANAFHVLNDAAGTYTAGDMKHAYLRALESLSHSVGIFHPDYAEAATLAQ